MLLKEGNSYLCIELLKEGFLGRRDHVFQLRLEELKLFSQKYSGKQDYIPLET